MIMYRHVSTLSALGLKNATHTVHFPHHKKRVLAKAHPTKIREDQTFHTPFHKAVRPRPTRLERAAASTLMEVWPLRIPHSSLSTACPIAKAVCCISTMCCISVTASAILGSSGSGGYTMGGKGGDTMAVNGGDSCGIGAVARGGGGTGSGAVPAGGGGTDSSAVATGAGKSDSGAPAASAPCLAVRAEGMAAAAGTSGDPFAFAAATAAAAALAAKAAAEAGSRNSLAVATRAAAAGPDSGAFATCVGGTDSGAGAIGGGGAAGGAPPVIACVEMAW